MKNTVSTILISAAVGAGSAVLVASVTADRLSREVATSTTEAAIEANENTIRENRQRLETFRDELLDVEQRLENPGLPVGTLLPYAGPLDEAEEKRLRDMGWLPARGQILSRDEYALLFEVIGNTFGATESLRTFRLPDLAGRTVIGAGVYEDPVSGRVSRTLGQELGSAQHQLTVKELPEHTHALKVQSARNDLEGEYPVHRYAGRGNNEVSSERSGNNVPHNNMPPSLVTQFLIRFR